jgi:hypothetical protein
MTLRVELDHLADSADAIAASIDRGEPIGL